MKIYCAHSTGFDFKHDFYDILVKGLDKEHILIFPHQDETAVHSKELIKSSHLIIAEVSEPSIGVGIELGWADGYGIPIIAMYSEGHRPSQSISHLTKNIIAYKNADDFIEKLKSLFQGQF